MNTMTTDNRIHDFDHFNLFADWREAALKQGYCLRWICKNKNLWKAELRAGNGAIITCGSYNSELGTGWCKTKDTVLAELRKNKGKEKLLHAIPDSL